MQLRFSELWRTDGSLGRRQYFLLGTLLFTLKFALDWFLSERVFGRHWSPLDYVQSSRWLTVNGKADQLAFLASIAFVSLPFVWSGVALTLRRLREAGQSPWLLVLFFIPLFKFLFFGILCLLPPAPPPIPISPSRSGFLGRWIPRSGVGSAVVAMGSTLLLAVASVLLGTSGLRNYGMTLFVGLPFCMGFLAVVLFTWHAPRRFSECLLVAFGTLLLGSLLLLGLAIEGAVCLLMAAPLAAGLTFIGAAFAFLIQSSRWRGKSSPPVVCSIALAIPLLMTLEQKHPLADPLLTVSTAVEINAPPEQVWPHVIRFPELPPPSEWFFKAGIAYPIRAQIDGSGPGAIRRCEFSTGPFVEPIEVWDEPHLLKFSVTANPAPMAEWTPYRSIHPAHLDGFLASNGGQFKLIDLGNGRTRLEGTTWYRHHMQPAAYWQLLSDALIHRIHLRVLLHVKSLAEEPQR